ncbi:tRNA 2-thiouridine(34) synthase MnmA [uncultured Agathobaculum sp.]|uniref:tRNA 2-thiouridine(34) synthase MnmA n=1 Tax=uncultured Agathobaculum sp. TaxID=2048140 RepID=UPI002602D121|nr:tRNA 2-thiouridine(34) synthase MnmA [uncultured Agathobaculum sp.]
MAEKVVLGLSGGVDSAVAAARLRDMGYEVYGLFLEVGLGGEEAAQHTADDLGIPLYIAHRREAFEQQICGYFADSFRNARTPNPCVMCNPLIKFRALTDYADEIGAAYIATGHYARTGRDAEGRALLRRARAEKDQSYMLYRLPRKTVARCVFPLGEAENKAEVRENAREIGLSVSEKPDSMDVCFIPDGDTQGWLERHGAACPPGNFVDENGKVLGQHKGIHCYTVGQRKGLGVAAEGRLFVHELRPETNEVVLSLEDVFRREITVRDVHYIAPEYAENGAFTCEVRVRFSRRSDRAAIYPNGTGARIVFEDAVRAPAAGQSAVFYDGDIVIGGGFIE